MYWSLNNKKRKYNEYNEYNGHNESNKCNCKKPKLFDFDDNMIYSVGTEVHFTAEINKENVEKIIKEITKIIEKNKKKSELNIAYIVDSPGGCVNSILKFVDFIKMVKIKHPKVKFISIVTGLVASAGTIMCIVADKRLMTKNAHAMIHELSSGNSGKYTHLMSYSQYLSSIHNTLLNIYLENSNKSKEELELLLNTETWFNAKEYLEGGFIDGIK